MDTEPDAAAGTSKRRSSTHQEITVRGAPIILSSPTPSQPAQKRARHTQPTPIARLDLLRTTGRSQRATDIHTGLDASIHAHANTATDSLIQVLGEQDRRLNATRTVLKLVASSLDNITATCDHDLKGHAEKIITLFTSFLKTTILEPNNSPDALSPGPDGKTWAQTAQPTYAKQPTQTIHEPPRKQAQHGTVKKTEDLRIFARIPDEHRDGIKAYTNFALRHTICKQLSMPIADIPDVHHIATGLAIRPKDQATRAKILAKKDLEETRLPRTLIIEEIYAQTKTKPKSARPSRHIPDPTTNPEQDTQTWIISFLQPVRPFRLFGTSSLARTIEKKCMPTRHNPGCQGYHTNRFCGRNPRCGHCGEIATEDKPHAEPCNKPAKCANCYGPAPADHESCPAKPIRKNGRLQRPTKKELSAIRRLGRKQYQAKNLNRTTESGENTNNVIINDEDAYSDHSDTTIPDLPAEKTGEAEDATDRDMDTGPSEVEPLAQETRHRWASRARKPITYTNDPYAFLGNDEEA
ncbi:hypothetical protein HZS61_004986 [Fusarium oxysporum f. sp. conglutinans]|uniref:Uncharacterized protein n=1 Tax=Fusarium oxysporum f. sp. conglutinans TaxID=100902 RepID=A0A8H6GCH0_FUSOX|nr:hypothetical protein HZS61_004986 [Fusarium oxysporum f. sp. conglutinans]KAG6978999.1 hypothetical protein FocnCong_v010988 [Fusarium oxysporum f. sp. conglutinans]